MTNEPTNERPDIIDPETRVKIEQRRIEELREAITRYQDQLAVIQDHYNRDLQLAYALAMEKAYFDRIVAAPDAPTESEARE